MNRLQLVQRLHLECGVSGARPATTINQSGEFGRLVAWIDAAWMDIQSAHQDWQWLRASCSFATVEGRSTYTAAQCGVTDLGMWVRDSFRVYNTTAGINSEIPLGFIDYEDWRNTYLLGANRSTYSQPREITIAPDKSLGFGPITAAGHTILGDYYRAPSEMAADADTPALPSQFHLAIVYRAMMHYGAFEAAPEVYQRGEKWYKTMLKRMELDRLPGLTFAGALA